MYKIFICIFILTALTRAEVQAQGRVYLDQQNPKIPFGFDYKVETKPDSTSGGIILIGDLSHNIGLGGWSGDAGIEFCTAPKREMTKMYLGSRLLGNHSQLIAGIETEQVLIQQDKSKFSIIGDINTSIKEITGIKFVPDQVDFKLGMLIGFNEYWQFEAYHVCYHKVLSKTGQLVAVNPQDLNRFGLRYIF
jgi:hypothetical protein